MKIVILGAAGFIGTNLAMNLVKNELNELILVDVCYDWIRKEITQNNNVVVYECAFEKDTDYESILQGADVVYHLVSTTIPATSNQKMAKELESNIIVTANILDACVRCNVKKVVFISSGGAIYGKNVLCPISEDAELDPITSYGLQKLAIEKMLYIYNLSYGLDYKIVRLANPYGPYQRPNSGLGVITTFVYRALRGESIEVFGDGTVIRDYIYVDDAIQAIVNIASKDSKYNIYNVGSGKGTDINTILKKIKTFVNCDAKIKRVASRAVDVPINFLDIERYEKEFGTLTNITLDEGIERTCNYILKEYIA